MLLESEISISRIETGVQTNCFVRYATSLDPFQWSANGGLDPGQYMGFAVVSGETAPTDPKDYSFAPVAGDAGRSVESVSEEYYLSTSSDSLTGGSWSSSYPSYVEGTYLWTRMKVTYSNPSGTSYGTPVLDAVWSEISDLQNSVQTLQTDFTVEQGKVNTFISETNTKLSNTSSQINNIQSTVNGTTQTISSLQTTVNTHGTDIAEIQSNITEINATAEGISTMVTAAQSTAEAASSTATQNADKIGWLVQSGSSSTNFTLTPRVIGLVGENIDLTGKVQFNSLSSDLQSKVNTALVESKVEYAQNTSATTAPTAGWSTTAPSRVAGKYIWQRIVSTDTAGNETISTPVNISGADGATGKGISSTTVTYQNGKSGTTVPTGTWQTSVPAAVQGKYLWTKTVTAYTDSTSTASYSVSYYAVDGTNGTNGTNGANGVSVTSIKAKYLTTSAGSGVTTSTSGWADTPTATTTTNKYLWTYEIITYSNSTTANLTPRIISTHGATGTTGATGRGITSITVEFYSSTSKTTQTGGSWSTTCPLWSAGHYLWKRNKIVYENPTSTVYTTAEVDSSWEAINEIQIGGTNLVLDSDRLYENNYYPVHEYFLSEDLVVGQKYAIRIWGELGSDKDFFGLWFNRGYNEQGALTDNGDGTYSLKFTASGTINDEDLRKISIYAYPRSVITTSRIDRIMFEKGTVCTDYSPSPQDKANQAIIDAWTSEAIIDEAGTQINGGYIQTNTISTKHLVVDDIFASGSAVMNIINAQTVNAERITSGTIDVKRISLYEMSVKSSANSNIETFAVSKDGEVTIRGDIESYSYNPGTAGWSIHKDGSAEFNNVTVRGDLITDNGGISKDSANGNIPAVTIWAGDTYENRKSAPFIVYSDGTMKATKGEFSGVFTGNVEIGNIKIADPSSTSGRDALLTIQDGSNGVYRVKLTDLDTSTFAQNIEVTDTLNQLKTGMRMDGTVYAASSVNVGENTQLTSHLLEINNVTMKSESGKFIFEDVVEFGRTEKHSSVKLYGDLNVTDEFQIGKTIKIGSIATIKVVANGFDIDFIES